jgi:hypothetical protein
LRTESKKTLCDGPFYGIIPSIFKGPPQAETGRWVASPTVLTPATSSIRNTFMELKASAVGGQI